MTKEHVRLGPAKGRGLAMNDPVLFVSHVSDDRDATMEIVAELERRGIRCWVAPRNVRLGRPFDDEIDAAIKKCLAMLLIFSDHCNEKRLYQTGADSRRKLSKTGASRPH